MTLYPDGLDSFASKEVAFVAREYVCDCGRTKVVVEEPAEYPYGDARQVQCTVCGTYVKEYAALERAAGAA